jgi:hypothetical protein
MAIRDFGESLLADVRERKDAQARDARKRAKSQERKDVLQGLLFKGAVSIGNSVLANKNEKFLQNENFYARSAKLKTNIAENNKVLNDWNTSLAHEDGQDAYFNAKAASQIEQKFMTDTFKASLSPQNYAAFMKAHTSELGMMMKENAKANFEKASKNVSAWGADPEKAFKKSLLKGKPQNVTQLFTLPLVNLFNGKDERTPNQAALDSIESEKGLESQGKVDAKDVRSIYEQTNNFEYALDTAIELKEFRDRFKAAGDALPKAKPIRGETYTARLPDQYGNVQEVSVYDMTQGDLIISTNRLDTGKPITAQISGASLLRAAQGVPTEEIGAIEASHRELTSEKDQKEVIAYKEEWLGTNEPTDKEIASFNQNFYGQIAIGAKTLSTKFKSVEGWNANFAIQLSTQMGIENLKATKKTTGVYGFRETAYNNEKSLLSNDDHYHPVIALKALKTLESRGNIPEFLVPQLEKAIADADYSTRNLNVSQENTAAEIYESLYPPEKIKKEPIEATKKIENKPPQSIEKIIEEVSLLEEPEVIDPNETPKEKVARKRRAVDKLRKERERKIKEGLSSFLSSVQSNEGISTKNYSEYTD